MYRPDYTHEYNNSLYQDIMMRNALQKNVPSMGDIFTQSISHSFHDATFMHAGDYLSTLESDEEANLLTKEEYNASPYARDRISWHDGMTETQAKVLAERHDRDAFYSMYTKNVSAFNPARIGGMIVGGIPDPINYIPFLGWAGRISKVARTLNKMPVLGMAANSMVNQAAFETAKYTAIYNIGGDIDYKAAVLDVAIAGLIGSGAGLLFGGVGKNSGLQEKLGQIDYQKKLPWTEHSEDLVVSGVHVVDGVPVNNRGERLLVDKDAPPEVGHPPTKEPDKIWTQEEWRQEQIKNQEKTIDDEVNETRRSKPPEEMNVAEKTVEALANVFRQAKSCTLGLFT